MKYLGLWSPGLWFFFEKFVKTSGPHFYILNVRCLTGESNFKNKLETAMQKEDPQLAKN